MKKICFILLAGILAVSLSSCETSNTMRLQALTDSMSPAIKKGDTIVVKKCSIDDIKIADIITYYVSEDTSITHRVIDIIETENGREIVTKGDNNTVADSDRVTKDNFYGIVTKIK